MGTIEHIGSGDDCGCCTEGGDTGWNPCCDGPCPSSLHIDATGITPLINPCGHCYEYVGEFDLTIDPTYGGHCKWYLDVDDPCLGSPYKKWVLTIGIGCYINLWAGRRLDGTGGYLAHWWKTTPTTCVDQSLIYAGGSVQCAFSGSISISGF